MVSPHFAMKAVEKCSSEFGSRVTEGWEVKWILPGVAALSVWVLRVTLAQAILLVVWCSPAATEQACIGDSSNRFCWLSSDAQGRWGIESEPGPSRRTSEEQQQEMGPETGLRKRFPSTLVKINILGGKWESIWGQKYSSQSLWRTCVLVLILHIYIYIWRRYPVSSCSWTASMFLANIQQRSLKNTVLPKKWRSLRYLSAANTWWVNISFQESLGVGGGRLRTISSHPSKSYSLLTLPKNLSLGVSLPFLAPKYLLSVFSWGSEAQAPSFTVLGVSLTAGWLYWDDAALKEEKGLVKAFLLSEWSGFYFQF